MISKNKSGIDTQIGQSGIFFSEGQKQRIGIARLFYFGREILFLDEFTSALDYENEKTILDEIIKIKKEKIIFLISHLDRVLDYSDKIIEIKEGEVKFIKDYEK